jgi:hypothetical protein
LIDEQPGATVPPAIVDLANPDKKPPVPLAVKVMTVTFIVTALSALLLARGDDGSAPMGTFVEKLRIAGQDVDVPTALCCAGVLVAGAFVLRYVVSIGGPQDPYMKRRRAQAAARRRERSVAQR